MTTVEMLKIAHALLQENPDVWAVGIELRMRDGRFFKIAMPSGSLLISRGPQPWWQRLLARFRR